MRKNIVVFICFIFTVSANAQPVPGAPFLLQPSEATQLAFDLLREFMRDLMETLPDREYSGGVVHIELAGESTSGRRDSRELVGCRADYLHMSYEAYTESGYDIDRVVFSCSGQSSWSLWFKRPEGSFAISGMKDFISLTWLGKGLGLLMNYEIHYELEGYIFERKQIEGIDRLRILQSSETEYGSIILEKYKKNDFIFFRLTETGDAVTLKKILMAQRDVSEDHIPERHYINELTGEEIFDLKLVEDAFYGTRLILGLLIEPRLF